MQYQPTLSRTELEDLAIHKYFGNVDQKNLDAVLDCFQDTAVFTVQTAFTVHEGQRRHRENVPRLF